MLELSNKTVQCAFIKEFNGKAPAAVQFWKGHKFNEEVFLCRMKRSERPAVLQEITVYGKKFFLSKESDTIARDS